MSAEIIKKRMAFDGWMKLIVAQVRLADGHVADREIVERGRCVSVLPYDPERKVALLVRQFRAPVLLEAGEQELLETIAGMSDGDGAEEAVRREASEEAGLKLNDLEWLGVMWTSPGGLTERMDLYLAPYSHDDRIGKGGGVPDEHENITVAEIRLAELAAMADAAKITDMKTLALIQTLRLKRPELFRA